MCTGCHPQLIFSTHKLHQSIHFPVPYPLTMVNHLTFEFHLSELPCNLQPGGFHRVPPPARKGLRSQSPRNGSAAPPPVLPAHKKGFQYFKDMRKSKKQVFNIQDRTDIWIARSNIFRIELKYGSHDPIFPV